MPARPEDGTICDVIRHWAGIQPDAPALYDDDGEPLTYGKLADRIDDIRAALNDSELGHGDRIAIVHSGGLEMASLMLGIISGAVAVPLDPRHTAGEFAIHLRDRKVKAAVMEDGVPEAAVLAAERLGIPVFTPAELVSVPHGPPDPSGRSCADDVALVLGTTGTTGDSKIVPRAHKRLLARVLVEEKSCELSCRDVGIVMRPLHYSGPFLSVLSALFAGGSIVVQPHFDAREFFGYLRETGATWYAAGPTFQRAIYAHALQNPEDVQGICLRHIRVGSASLDCKTADGLEHLFSAGVLTSYGSTESGRIALSCPLVAPRRAGTVGMPIDRIGFAHSEVRIRSLDGQFQPAGRRGEIVVRGPQVFGGYENDPEANAEAFVDGWFRTGDEGFFDEEGYLTLTGRIKEMINRGGEKVSPAEVDAALMAHPDVREGATFPIPHATLGEEVAAAVVQEAGAALTDEILRRYLLKRLSGFKVPRRFVFVDEIPKSPYGKVQRYKLAEALGLTIEAGPAGGAEAGRAPTPLEARLQSMWARALRVPDVGLDDNFFLLGGDSLQAVELFLEIERALGHRLPRAVLFEAGTVTEMARLIEANTPPRCLAPIRPEGSRPPFFCVHDGNGHVLNFRDLAKHLGPDQSFYGIQCPGLDGKEMPFTELGVMAAHYVREIKKVQPEGPYYIGGYSFGRRVAYVMAQQMHEWGDEVALLALLDTSSHRGHIPVTLPRWFWRHIARLRGLSLRDVPPYIAMRFENLALEARRATLTRLYGWALALYRSRGRPVPRWLYRPVEANDLIRRATELTPYEGDAVLFQTAESADRYSDGKNGWEALVQGKLDVVPVPGQHYQIVKEPHVRALAAALAARIDAAVAPTSAWRTVPDASGPQAKDAPSPPQAAAPSSR